MNRISIQMCVTGLLVFTAAPTSCRGADVLPTAQEVLDRTQSVMTSPLRYTVKSGVVPMKVMQKRLPDGQLLTRMESDVPFRKVSLQSQDSLLDIYPDHGVIIDLQFSADHMGQLREKLKQSVAGLPAIEQGKPVMKGRVNQNGTSCFEVEVKLPSALPGLIAEMAGPDTAPAIPETQHLFVAMDTYHLVRTEMRASSGTLISYSDFSGFESATDLADALFIAPDGMEVRKPSSMIEYVQMLSDLTPVQLDPERRQMESELATQEIMDEIERIVGESNAYAEELVTASLAHDYTTELAPPVSVKLNPLEAASGSRRTVFLLSAASLALCCFGALYASRRSTSRNAS